MGGNIQVTLNVIKYIKLMSLYWLASHITTGDGFITYEAMGIKYHLESEICLKIF